ncbi:beta-lactamase domain containing protein, partial [mine drainage metagenome]
MPGRTELWLETFRHPELGNASYLVGSGREAGVIDPVRDVGRYLISARERGAQIRWVLETHLHNDFLSGGRELARRAGAVLGAPRGSRLAFPHRTVSEGERLDLDGGFLLGRASPGHTPEHTSYLLVDEHGRPRRLFSGGSLMVGSAARPDLR